MVCEEGTLPAGIALDMVEDGVTYETGRRFRWEVLVPLVVHPMRVEIIEAMEWIGRPLAASELSLILDHELSHLSYHVNELVKLGVLREVHNKKVRGALKRFYRVVT